MSPAREEKGSWPPSPEAGPSIELSGFLLGLRKSKTAPFAINPYPRSKAPPKPRKMDEFLMVEGLSPLEFTAMKSLGLHEEMSLKRSAVKQAYRRLVLTLHPDRHPPGLSQQEQQRRTEEFQAIHEAYTVLDQAFRRLPRKQ